MTAFAGGGAYRSFVERVALDGSDRETAGALERWAELERNGWDVTALAAADGSHMIGLGCLYLEEPARVAC